MVAFNYISNVNFYDDKVEEREERFLPHKELLECVSVLNLCFLRHVLTKTVVLTGDALMLVKLFVRVECDLKSTYIKVLYKVL